MLNDIVSRTTNAEVGRHQMFKLKGEWVELSNLNGNLLITIGTKQVVFSQQDIKRFITVVEEVAANVDQGS